MDLIQELPFLIKKAAEQVYLQDADLMSLKGNEESVVFRFAIYLNQMLKNQMPESVVLDIEYNKMGLDTKRLFFKKENGEKNHRIIPDIILHQRMTSNNNLLVIECKREVSQDKNDSNKLKAMTSDPNYRYKLGCFINFTKHKPEFTYFIDGEITKDFAKVIL